MDDQVHVRKQNFASRTWGCKKERKKIFDKQYRANMQLGATRLKQQQFLQHHPWDTDPSIPIDGIGPWSGPGSNSPPFDAGTFGKYTEVDVLGSKAFLQSQIPSFSYIGRDSQVFVNKLKTHQDKGRYQNARCQIKQARQRPSIPTTTNEQNELFVLQAKLCREVRRAKSALWRKSSGQNFRRGTLDIYSSLLDLKGPRRKKSMPAIRNNVSAHCGSRKPFVSEIHHFNESRQVPPPYLVIEATGKKNILTSQASSTSALREAPWKRAARQGADNLKEIKWCKSIDALASKGDREEGFCTSNSQEKTMDNTYLSSEGKIPQNMDTHCMPLIKEFIQTLVNRIDAACSCSVTDPKQGHFEPQKEYASDYQDENVKESLPFEQMICDSGSWHAADGYSISAKLLGIESLNVCKDHGAVVAGEQTSFNRRDNGGVNQLLQSTDSNNISFEPEIGQKEQLSMTVIKSQHPDANRGGTQDHIQLPMKSDPLSVVNLYVKLSVSKDDKQKHKRGLPPQGHTACSSHSLDGQEVTEYSEADHAWKNSLLLSSSCKLCGVSNQDVKEPPLFKDKENEKIQNEVKDIQARLSAGPKVESGVGDRTDKMPRISDYLEAQVQTDINAEVMDRRPVPACYMKKNYDVSGKGSACSRRQKASIWRLRKRVHLQQRKLGNAALENTLPILSSKDHDSPVSLSGQSLPKFLQHMHVQRVIAELAPSTLKAPAKAQFSISGFGNQHTSNVDSSLQSENKLENTVRKKRSQNKRSVRKLSSSSGEMETIEFLENSVLEKRREADQWRLKWKRHLLEAEIQKLDAEIIETRSRIHNKPCLADVPSSMFSYPGQISNNATSIPTLVPIWKSACALSAEERVPATNSASLVSEHLSMDNESLQSGRNSEIEVEVESEEEVDKARNQGLNMSLKDEDNKRRCLLVGDVNCLVRSVNQKTPQKETHLMPLTAGIHSVRGEQDSANAKRRCIVLGSNLRPGLLKSPTSPSIKQEMDLEQHATNASCSLTGPFCQKRFATAVSNTVEMVEGIEVTDKQSNSPQTISEDSSLVGKTCTIDSDGEENKKHTLLSQQKEADDNTEYHVSSHGNCNGTLTRRLSKEELPHSSLPMPESGNEDNNQLKCTYKKDSLTEYMNMNSNRGDFIDDKHGPQRNDRSSADDQLHVRGSVSGEIMEVGQNLCEKQKRFHPGTIENYNMGMTQNALTIENNHEILAVPAFVDESVSGIYGRMEDMDFCFPKRPEAKVASITCHSEPCSPSFLEPDKASSNSIQGKPNKSDAAEKSFDPWESLGEQHFEQRRDNTSSLYGTEEVNEVAFISPQEKVTRGDCIAPGEETSSQYKKIHEGRQEKLPQHSIRMKDMHEDTANAEISLHSKSFQATKSQDGDLRISCESNDEIPEEISVDDEFLEIGVSELQDSLDSRALENMPHPSLTTSNELRSQVEECLERTAAQSKSVSCPPKDLSIVSENGLLEVPKKGEGKTVLLSQISALSGDSVEGNRNNCKYDAELVAESIVEFLFSRILDQELSGRNLKEWGKTLLQRGNVSNESILDENMQSGKEDELQVENTEGKRPSFSLPGSPLVNSNGRPSSLYLWVRQTCADGIICSSMASPCSIKQYDIEVNLRNLLKSSGILVANNYQELYVALDAAPELQKFNTNSDKFDKCLFDCIKEYLQHSESISYPCVPSYNSVFSVEKVLKSATDWIITSVTNDEQDSSNLQDCVEKYCPMEGKWEEHSSNMVALVDDIADSTFHNIVECLVKDLCK